MAPQPLYAANLGVHFVPIGYGNGTFGLRLAGAPIPGSPASQLPLDAGDVIFALDGQRFANLNDVANHVDRTIVDFVDAGTNTLQRGTINLPSAAGRSRSTQGARPRAPMVGGGGNQIGQALDTGNGSQRGQANGGPGFAQGGARPQLAPNLGIFYLPIRFADGSLGLRLTGAPRAGSPASQLPLDAGDVILALDGQLLRNPNDVATHFDLTTVDFLDAGTNTVQRGTINLPSVAGPSQSIPGGAAGAPMAAGGTNQIAQAMYTGNAPQPGASNGGTGGGPGPQLARNLWILYLPIRFGDGTLGLKLTRAPLPGSPASQLPLDAGDVIFALDGQRFANPNDVANHFDQTTLDFIDSGTNTQQRGNINLPSQNQ
jgi:membrane-associated protease RseP (regulator of RpoE activity)